MRNIEIGTPDRFFFASMVICAAAIFAAAQAPARNGDVLIAYDDVRANGCSTTDANVGLITANTSSASLLFNRTFRGQPNPNFCAPVLNPDRSQMNLGQYEQVSGRAAVKCVKSGTHTTLKFFGLRPNGVYTIWTVLLDSAPGPPIGVGGLGDTTLSENSFTADIAGVGQIVRITPEEDLSIFGHVGPCMLDAPFVYELVFHSDNLTHGGDPGPPNTWVTNAIFLFQ